MIPEVLAHTVSYVLSLDTASFIRVFWFFIIFDFPRNILGDLYILFYSLTHKSEKNEREKEFLSELEKRPPLISVIIPALNEEATIGWTIRSLQEQSYQNLELIIVDDGSDDKTPEICRSLSHAPNVNYYRFEQRAGKSAVLNYGLKHAHGEYIIFVDSDTTFDRDAIFKLMAAFADPKVGGASGNLRARNAHTNLLTVLQQAEYIFSISIGRRIRARLGILPIISGAFGGFRRDLIALDAIGGHEPGPGNDSDLAIRVRKKGYRIVFIPEANCLTNVPEKMNKLIKQRQRWDRNIVKNRIRKHKNVFNPFSRNFKVLDSISFIDSIFFHVILAAVSIYYVIDLTLNYPDYLIQILLINYILYLTAEIFEMIIAVLLSGHKKDLLIILYLPLLNPYKMFLKVNRLIAYAQELFFYASNRDPFAPSKVQSRMIQW